MNCLVLLDFAFKLCIEQVKNHFIKGYFSPLLTQNYSKYFTQYSMKYEIFHTECWEKELFLAPCQLWGIVPWLPPNGLRCCAHTHMLISVQLQTWGPCRPLGLSAHAALLASGLCPPNSSRVGISTVSAPSSGLSQSTAPRGFSLCHGLQTLPSTWGVAAVRLVSLTYISHRSLSFIALCLLLEECCFIGMVVFQVRVNLVPITPSWPETYVFSSLGFMKRFGSLDEALPLNSASRNYL